MAKPAKKLSDLEKLLRLVRIIRNRHPEAEPELTRALSVLVSKTNRKYEKLPLGCCKFAASCANTTKAQCDGQNGTWNAAQSCNPATQKCSYGK